MNEKPDKPYVIMQSLSRNWRHSGRVVVAHYPSGSAKERFATKAEAQEAIDSLDGGTHLRVGIEDGQGNTFILAEQEDVDNTDPPYVIMQSGSGHWKRRQTVQPHRYDERRFKSEAETLAAIANTCEGLSSLRVGVEDSDGNILVIGLPGDMQ